MLFEGKDEGDQFHLHLDSGYLIRADGWFVDKVGPIMLMSMINCTATTRRIKMFSESINSVFLFWRVRAIHAGNV